MLKTNVAIVIPGLKKHEVLIDVGDANLPGELTLMDAAKGVVLFAHGSGSGRHSPRNQFVASALHLQGIGTLLIDLLTKDEEKEDQISGHLRFDVGMLADRLHRLTRWLEVHPQVEALPIGYFGASTGAAAALLASVKAPQSVKAIVSRGGRPDLAGAALKEITTPTLLIVGSQDSEVIKLNESAIHKLSAKEKKLEIVSGATHLFEEPGTLERVAILAADWFAQHGLK